jgi:hypothetical protein
VSTVPLPSAIGTGTSWGTGGCAFSTCAVSVCVAAAVDVDAVAAAVVLDAWLESLLPPHALNESNEASTEASADARNMVKPADFCVSWTMMIPLV